MSRNNILAFAAGLIVGGIGTYFGTKKYFEDREQKAVDSVKEMYYNRAKILDEAKEVIEADEASKQERIVEDAQKAYTNYSRTSVAPEPVEVVEHKGPYVISPDSLGELDYEIENWTFYADGIVCDEDDQIIPYPETYIGENFDTHFGDYATDEVQIRNDDRRTDYEILRDHRTYKDVVGDTVPPYNMH